MANYGGWSKYMAPRESRDFLFRDFGLDPSENDLLFRGVKPPVINLADELDPSPAPTTDPGIQWADEHKRLTKSDARASIYAAIGNAGSALMAGALDPSMSGIGQAMGAFQGTLSEETRERAKLQRDLEDRELERQRMEMGMRHAEAGESREVGRYGWQGEDRTREEKARSIFGEFLGGAEGLSPLDRAAAEAGILTGNFSGAHSALDSSLDAEADLSRDKRRAFVLGEQENDLRLTHEGELIERGWRVPEREQYNKSNELANRRFNFDNSRYDFDRRIRATDDFSTKFAMAERAAIQRAHQLAQISFKQSKDVGGFKLASDLENPDLAVQERARQSDAYRAVFRDHLDEQMTPHIGSLRSLANEYGTQFGDDWVRSNVPSEYHDRFGIKAGSSGAVLPGELDGGGSSGGSDDYYRDSHDRDDARDDYGSGASPAARSGMSLPDDLYGRVSRQDPENLGLAEEVENIRNQNSAGVPPGLSPTSRGTRLPTGLDVQSSADDVAAYRHFSPTNASEADLWQRSQAQGKSFAEFMEGIAILRGPRLFNGRR